MDDQSAGNRRNDRGGSVNDAANRRIGEWADLSAMSRPAAVNEEVRRAVLVAAPERRRSRQPLAGLAAAVVVVLVAAGLGFGLAGRPSSVAPSASSSAAASESESPVVSPAGPPSNWWLSPSPSSAPSALPSGASVGDKVWQMRRLDATNGWALSEMPAVAGGGAPRLLLTNDAGTTWRDATPAGETDYQPTIEFIDADHGWLLETDGPLWRTADGGRTWRKTALPAGRTGMSAAMSFVSPSTGFLLLSANSAKSPEPWVVYRTNDGGASLQRAGTATLPDQPPMSGPEPMMAFSDPLDGIVAGWQAVLRTQDGGAHWSTVSVPVSFGARYSGVYQLRAFGPNVVLVAYLDGATAPGATTYASGDAGRTWRSAAAIEIIDYSAIVDGQTWLQLGMHGTESVHIRVTRDAGATWTSSTGSGPAGRHVMAVSFVSATDGWAIFQVDSTCPPTSMCPIQPENGQLAQTHDGGVTWQVLP
jgi:photosystem II stability/assembly factor-like uncharacterized protein